jgi:hypothetical protein
METVSPNNVDSQTWMVNVPFQLTLFLAAAVVGIPLSSFFDRGTTITVNLHTIIIVWAATAIPTMLIALWHWFRPREDLIRIPHWRQKHDSPGRWVLHGISAALFCGFILTACAYEYTCVTAQYVSGRRTQTPAIVKTIQRVSGRHRVCERRASFFVTGQGVMDTCVKPVSAAPLLNDGVRVGDRVTLLIEENLFGTVLVGITTGFPDRH